MTGRASVNLQSSFHRTCRSEDMHSDHLSARKRYIGLTPPLHPSIATLEAVAEALPLAHACHEQGRLISPSEAMALACKDSRDKETLYSIARQCAWRYDGDTDDVLYYLSEKFPDFT